MEKSKDGTEYNMYTPHVIAWPIFFQSDLDKARANKIIVESWGGQIGLPADSPVLAEVKKLMLDLVKKAKADGTIPADASQANETLHFPLESGAKKQEGGKNAWSGDLVWLKVGSPIIKRDKTPGKIPPVYRSIGGKAERLKDNNDEVLYSGCYVTATLTFRAYPGNGKNIVPGVKCFVNSLGFIKDGERIGGRSGNELFSQVEGKVSDENPLDTDEMVV